MTLFEEESNRPRVTFKETPIEMSPKSKHSPVKAHTSCLTIQLEDSPTELAKTVLKQGDVFIVENESPKRQPIFDTAITSVTMLKEDEDSGADTIDENDF